MKKLFRAKETFEPLYHQGDLFMVIRINTDPVSTQSSEVIRR
ncbi:MAG: hypothetical protein AABW67_01835 [Nanoarchaeota archaeon]